MPPPDLAEFEATARDPKAWQFTAHQFALAASALDAWYDHAPIGIDDADVSVSLHGYPLPMMVLYAVAAENLLKAILVAKGEDPLANEELSARFSNHNLLEYAKRTGANFDDDQRLLLEHLADIIRSGKYPIPRAPGKDPRAWEMRYPDDVKRIKALLGHLENALLATGRECLPKWDFQARYLPPDAKGEAE